MSRTLFAAVQAVIYIFFNLPQPLFVLPQLYEAFTFLKGLGAVILVHAENGDLIAQVSGVEGGPPFPLQSAAVCRRSDRRGGGIGQ